MSNCCANSASVLSPRTAAKATFALKAGVWFRRGRLVIVLYVGFVGRSIISGLWQGSGQPVHRLGIEAWRRDCGPAPHTLLIRLDGILGRIAPDPAYKVDEQQILPSTSCKYLRVHGNGHHRLAWHRHRQAEVRCRAELEDTPPRQGLPQ